jgi:phosphatidylserine decarboxylase
MLDWSRLRERVAVDILRWTPKGTFSRGVGWLARRTVPRALRRPLYGGFARTVGADLSAVDGPLDQFERFDDFFTRPLVPGARPVDGGEGAVVSPVDGVVSETGVAEGGRLIQCKGLDYTVRGLLADAVEARAFEGGAYATLYLAPRDYHRIHSPVEGKVSGYRHIPGAFFPVNPLSVRNVSGLFSINERLVSYLESELGRVAVVKVAATGVGHITLSYDRGVRTHRSGSAGRHGWVQRYAAPRPLARGGELGMFHLGSTVILLFEPGRVKLDLERGQIVRMGARIGQRVAQKSGVAA